MRSYSRTDSAMDLNMISDFTEIDYQFPDENSRRHSSSNEVTFHQNVTKLLLLRLQTKADFKNGLQITR